MPFDSELISKAQAGDKGARETLVQRWQPHIGKYAAKHASVMVPYADLMQEGTLALLAALQDYKHEKGSFANFAGLYIRRAVYWCAIAGEAYSERWAGVVPPTLPQLGKQECTTPIPLDCLSDQERFVVSRTFGLGCFCATPAEIAECLGVTSRRVKQILAGALERLRVMLPEPEPD